MFFEFNLFLLSNRLANALQPGSVARFNLMKGTFFHIENINFFVGFAKKAGVSKFDLFDPKDLTEDRGHFEKVNLTTLTDFRTFARARTHALCTHQKKT